MTQNTTLTIVIVAVLIVLAVGFFAWWKYYSKPATPISPAGTPTSTAGAPQTLGGQIYKQVQNPIQKLPTTNPFQAQTNPFGEAKVNPYSDIYRNPFQ